MDYGTLALEAVKTLGILAAAVTTAVNHQRLKRVSDRTKLIVHQTNGVAEKAPKRGRKKAVKHVTSLGV